MIVLFLIAALLQERSLAVMTPEANDRMTSEAFRANAEQAATLLSERADEEPVELRLRFCPKGQMRSRSNFR